MGKGYMECAFTQSAFYSSKWRLTHILNVTWHAYGLLIYLFLKRRRKKTEREKEQKERDNKNLLDV